MLRNKKVRKVVSLKDNEMKVILNTFRKDQKVG